jgi:hypothetical protein
MYETKNETNCPLVTVPRNRSGRPDLPPLRRGVKLARSLALAVSTYSVRWRWPLRPEAKYRCELPGLSPCLLREFGGMLSCEGREQA